MLLAKRSLNERLGKEAADWAIGQLERGFDGKYLRQLAGTLGDENPFELMPFYLLDCALDDLQRREISYYYADVTRGNFDQVLQDEIRKLMAVPIEYEPPIHSPSSG